MYNSNDVLYRRIVFDIMEKGENFINDNKKKIFVIRFVYSSGKLKAQTSLGLYSTIFGEAITATFEEMYFCCCIMPIVSVCKRERISDVPGSCSCCCYCRSL